jgi:basic membrane lipoprotein Med (substrate-binding protein (PBP1-ABC) superfamily)/ABC-type multidrug transport system ATPase subunit
VVLIPADTDTETGGEGDVEPNGMTVGLAYDVGGRGDQSFNDSAAAGVDQAVEEFGFEVEEAEAADGEAESAREERLRTFADAGVNPIIAVGFAYAPSVAKVAPEYPETYFALIDSPDATGENIANLLFAEEQGSFLVGAAAALETQTDNIGFVGGVNTPLINKFEAGYIAGAEAVNPDIEVQSQYLTEIPDFSGFGDPAKGKTTAEGMYQNGADIVYHAAGGSGGGVFEAASEADAFAIGSTPTSTRPADPSVQDVIITSMLKKVDVGVFEYLTEVNDGPSPPARCRTTSSRTAGLLTSGDMLSQETIDQLEDFSSRSSTARSRSRPSRDPLTRRGPGSASSVPRASSVCTPSPPGRGASGLLRRHTDVTTATTGPQTAGDIAVRLRGIGKTFPGVVANHDVDIDIRRGTVHAIVGENGAGKSTLMKILYGVQKPSSGTIEVQGRQLSLGSPSDAIKAGVGMVFQHFMLADNLTVLENVTLGAEKLHGIGDGAKKEILRISGAYGLDLEPDRLVADLGVGARQRIEILKVLYRGAHTIILDEPTAVLVPQEVDELFGNLRELKEEGLTVIFISHKLDEVLSVADEVTVIRRGTTVATVPAKSVTSHQLAELMVGAELPSPSTEESTVTDRPVLQVHDLNLPATAPGTCSATSR